MAKRTEETEIVNPHGFVRRVAVAKIGEAGLTTTVAASAAELERIARYLELESAQGLRAEIHLAKWRGKGVQLTGHFAADVTQACVVTLEPLQAHVEGDFERRFHPQSSEQGAREVRVDPEGEDPAEPLGREIELGEILVEELSLALDPYPRKAGAEFAVEQDTVAKADNPFAVLTKLKGKAVKPKPKG
jgi:uncharacterized metal-binding protein YceD (DUF177 family)